MVFVHFNLCRDKTVMFHHSVWKLLPDVRSEFQRKLSDVQIMINPVNRQTGYVPLFPSSRFYTAGLFDLQVFRFRNGYVADGFRLIKKRMLPSTSLKQIWPAYVIFSEERPKRACLFRISCSIMSRIFHWAHGFLSWGIPAVPANSGTSVQGKT